MNVRYMGWSGVEVEYAGETLLIDYIEDGSSIFQDGAFVQPLGPGTAAAAIVTHLHADHADPVALKRALGVDAPVFRPEPTQGSRAIRSWTAPVEERFRETKLLTHVAQPWTERQVGPFRLLAVPAVDGLGDPQLTWIVEAGGIRILHAGDTMNHGYWWAIAQFAGTIDVAFLPINGPVIQLPHLQPPSPFAAVLNPEEAAVAGHILGAGLVVPIHYGDINMPPVYVETQNPVTRFREQSEALGVSSMTAVPGEWFAAGGRT